MFLKTPIIGKVFQISQLAKGQLASPTQQQITILPFLYFCFLTINIALTRIRIHQALSFAFCSTQKLDISPNKIKLTLLS